MKKWLGGLIIAGVIVGGTTAAFATSESDGDENNFLNFNQMRPYMEKVHPNFSEDQLREMYNDCHGPNGASENFRYHGGMMGN